MATSTNEGDVPHQKPTGLDITRGDKIKGMLIIDADGNKDPIWGSHAVVVAGLAGTSRDLAFYTKDDINETMGSPRWEFRCDSTAESGANTGSNFQIEARNDDGSFHLTPLVVYRGSGRVVIQSSPGTEGASVLFYPPQYTDTNRPVFTSSMKGSMWYNTTTGKMMIGGAAKWETITSG